MTLMTDEIEKRKTSFFEKMKTAGGNIIDKSKEKWAENKEFNKELKGREHIGYKNEMLKQATLKGRERAKKGSLLKQILAPNKKGYKSQIRKPSRNNDFGFGLNLKSENSGAFGELPKKKEDKDNPFI